MDKPDSTSKIIELQNQIESLKVSFLKPFLKNSKRYLEFLFELSKHLYFKLFSVYLIKSILVLVSKIVLLIKYYN